MDETIFEQLSDVEIKEWLEEDYADMYCCSPECLELPYIDADL